MSNTRRAQSAIKRLEAVAGVEPEEKQAKGPRPTPMPQRKAKRKRIIARESRRANR